MPGLVERRVSEWPSLDSASLRPNECSRTCPISKSRSSIGMGKITRRELLRLSAGTLLTLGLWPGRLRGDGTEASEFTFLVVNDLHFREEACALWFEEAVAAMKASAPAAEFCLLCGDLADGGEPSQHVGIRDTFQGLGIPAYAAIGNHDYLTDTDRQSYEEIFSDQINYIFEHDGWQLVGIDTTQGNAWQNTNVSSDTLGWLDKHLPKLDRRKPTILFTHFPLGAEVSMRPLNADDVLTRFLEFNLGAVFCGHFHGYTERALGEALITTDRCCSRVRANHDGSKEKGWFVCRATSAGEVTREFVEFKPSV
jgi:Calcineurin-like phosphoesterase